jgi:hypothetical protein
MPLLTAIENGDLDHGFDLYAARMRNLQQRILVEGEEPKRAAVLLQIVCREKRKKPCSLH